MTEFDRIRERLSGRIGKPAVLEIARWAEVGEKYREYLWQLTLDDDCRVAVNSLWCLTHLGMLGKDWIASKQEEIINRLFSETDTSKKRMYLQLLREQQINSEGESVIRLLDYCLSKINSECEPYAIRCLSIYVAYNICHPFPELIAELKQYLHLLSTQTLSPGLKSALRQTNQRISKL